MISLSQLKTIEESLRTTLYFFIGCLTKKIAYIVNQPGRKPKWFSDIIFRVLIYIQLLSPKIFITTKSNDLSINYGPTK